MDLTPEQIRALAESIAFHASGGTGGTGHLADFNVNTREELVTRITDMLNDKNTEFFVNNSQRPDRAGTVVLFNDKTQSFLVFNPNQLNDAIPVGDRILPAGGPQGSIYGKDIGPDNLAGTFYRQPKLDGEGQPKIPTKPRAFLDRNGHPIMGDDGKPAQLMPTPELVYEDQIGKLRAGVIEDLNDFPPEQGKTYSLDDTSKHVPTNTVAENDDWARRIAAEDERIRTGLPLAMDRVQTGRYLAQDIRDTLERKNNITNNNVTTSGEGNELHIKTPKHSSDYHITFSEDGKTATVTTTSNRGNVHTVALDEAGTSHLIETMRSDDFMSSQKYANGLTSLDDIIRTRGTAITPAEVVADQDTQRDTTPTTDIEGDTDAKPKIDGEGDGPDTRPQTGVDGDGIETSRTNVGGDVDVDTDARITTGDADLKPPVASLSDAPDINAGNGNSDGTVRLVPTNVDPDAPRGSTWDSAVRNVDGGGSSRVGSVLQGTAGKAGFGLSAFHLKQQLLGENSTFKQDIQNEEVAGMATTALALDVGAFALDTVDLTADATRGGLALAKSAGYIDDVANLGRLGSGVSTLSKIGRVAGPIGTAITVVTTGIEYNIASATDDGKRAGQAVGAGGGALGGAAIGAGIGVWFFGVGAAPGAAIGGIIGAFGGGYAGGEVLDDDFQEYFDAQTLEEQRENLGKLEGIGENLDRFQELEQEYTQSLEALQEAYEGTDVAAIEAAQQDFEAKRMALTGHIENSLLTQSEIETLDSVDEFIQKQAQFYAEKEQRLTAAGDTEALQRLADSRQGLEQAAQSIHRLKNLSDMIGEGYGQNQEEAVQKAEEQIASVGAMVDERQESIVKYQAGLKQQEFGQAVGAQLDSVNAAYNDGITDNALMQRSAALIGLVESGDMNAEILSEASEDIAQLAQQHETELAQIKQAQAELLTLTRQQQQGGASEYKQGNLDALERYNTQIADLVASYEATGEVLEQATNMAENAAAVSELQNNAITVDPTFAPQVEELQSQFEQALGKDIPDPAEIAALQERAEALKQTAEQSLSEAEAREAQIKDMLESGIEIDGVRQPVENETTKQQLQDMLDEATELKQQSAQQVEALSQSTSNATSELDNRVLSQDAFSLTLDREGYVSSYSAGGGVDEFAEGARPMLVDGEAHIFSSVSGIENVPAQLSLYNGDVITKVGEPYQENSREDRTQRREIEDRSERRDVKREERDLTKSLDGKTMNDAVTPADTAPENSQGSMDNNTPITPASYHFLPTSLPGNIDQPFNEKSMQAGDIFPVQSLDAININPEPLDLNGGSGAPDYDTGNAQYNVDFRINPQIDTQFMNIPTFRLDYEFHVEELYTPTNSINVQPVDPELEIRTLRVSDPPDQSNIPGASENELSMSITDDPDYIEAAISMEKILAGEQLDDIEQQRLEEILNDPDIDSAVIASLSENYGDTAQSLMTNDDTTSTNVDADVATLAMAEEAARQDPTTVNQGTMKI